MLANVCHLLRSSAVIKAGIFLPSSLSQFLEPCWQSLSQVARITCPLKCLSLLLREPGWQAQVRHLIFRCSKWDEFHSLIPSKLFAWFFFPAASGKSMFQISSSLHEEIPTQFLPGLTFPELFRLCHLLSTFDTALNSLISSHEFSLELCFTMVTSESPLSQRIQVMFAQCQAAESVLSCLNSSFTATSSGPSSGLLGMWQRGRGRTRGNYFSLAEALVLEEPWCSWMSLDLSGGCWRQNSSSLKGVCAKIYTLGSFGENGMVSLLSGFACIFCCCCCCLLGCFWGFFSPNKHLGPSGTLEKRLEVWWTASRPHIRISPFFISFPIQLPWNSLFYSLGCFFSWGTRIPWRKRP